MKEHMKPLDSSAGSAVANTVSAEIASLLRISTTTSEDFQALLAFEIDAAVEAERAACEAIARGEFRSVGARDRIADAIAARAKTKPEEGE